MEEEKFSPPEKVKHFKNWKCPKCQKEPTKLQQVQYGHVENGRFAVDEKTPFACVYCHAEYGEQDLKA